MVDLIFFHRAQRVFRLFLVRRSRHHIEMASWKYSRLRQPCNLARILRVAHFFWKTLGTAWPSDQYFQLRYRCFTSSAQNLQQGACLKGGNVSTEQEFHKISALSQKLLKIVWRGLFLRSMWLRSYFIFDCGSDVKTAPRNEFIAWVSEVIHVSFGFALLCFVIGFAELA